MAKISLLSCRSNKRSDKFTSAVGKLMVNCGMLEALSQSWLMELGQNRLAKPKNDDLRTKVFNQRKDKILALICKYISDREFQRKLRNTWTRTEAIMKFRNSIAHAPLIESNGRSKVFYDAKSKTKVTLQEINPMIDQCSDIIDEINDLWGQLKA